MLRRRQPKKVETVFRGYFQRQALNNLVKNLYIIVPEIASLTKTVRVRLNNLFVPMLTMLFKEHQQMRKKVSIVDLSVLNNTLAIHLKNTSTHMIRISKNNIFKYEKMNLRAILNKQSELLRELIAEQHLILRQESQEILKQEQERLKNKYRAKNQNRNRK